MDDTDNKVMGFIVNIYDSVNFDIDIPLQDKERYKNVYQAPYTCIDLDNSQFVEPVQRIAYRCRIEGVSIDRNESNDSELKENNYRIVREANYKIKQRIMLCNSWVLCKIGAIDYYNRILIKIYDPITSKSLTEDIFAEYPNVFSEYSRN